jgi:hypothetical protein
MSSKLKAELINWTIAALIVLPLYAAAIYRLDH